MEYKRNKVRWSAGGSLQNRLAETSNAAPVVGEGATKLSYTDRSAYFVTYVSESGRECTIQRAKVKCLDYYAGQYKVEPDPQGYEINLYYRWGSWRVKLECGEYSIFRVAFGYASEYEDPHF